MEDHRIMNLPRRISGMLRLEALFNQNGYLICQASGTKIYDFDKVAAIFIPLDSSTDQVIAVHSDHATSFVQGCLARLSASFLGYQDGFN